VMIVMMMIRPYTSQPQWLNYPGRNTDGMSTYSPVAFLRHSGARHIIYVVASYLVPYSRE